MNLKKWWRSRLPEDEITEFLTKTERTKCNNRQNIHLLDGYYLLFEQYLQEKSSFYILNRAEKQAKVLKKVYKELGVEIRNLEIFCMI